MLLPHGYEGMGAEHSSARLERFLQLCAGLNMQVINCTTPANMFHALRRQQHRPFRKPLIAFTPKKLLRYPACVSSFDEFSSGKFQELLDDPIAEVNEVDTIMFMSGKIYYDIIEKKEAYGNFKNIALVRLEQINPIPAEQIKALLKKYSKAKKHFWVQEEPENMGAWSFILMKFPEVRLEVLSLRESSAPAAGSFKRSQIRANNLFDKVFAEVKLTNSATPV